MITLTEYFLMDAIKHLLKDGNDLGTMDAVIMLSCILEEIAAETDYNGRYHVIEQAS